MIPDAARVKRDAVALGDRKEWWIAEQNRVVPMQDSLYPNDTLFAAVCVIARPLAEGSLHFRLFFRRRHFAFDDNFRSCRNRQTAACRSYHLHRFAPERPGILIFAHPI